MYIISKILKKNYFSLKIALLNSNVMLCLNFCAGLYTQRILTLNHHGMKLNIFLAINLGSFFRVNFKDAKWIQNSVIYRSHIVRDNKQFRSTKGEDGHMRQTAFEMWEWSNSLFTPYSITRIMSAEKKKRERNVGTYHTLLLKNDFLGQKCQIICM